VEVTRSEQNFLGVHEQKRLGTPYLCESIDHVNVIRTCPKANNIVIAGYLVTVGTMMVTPGVDLVIWQ